MTRRAGRILCLALLLLSAGPVHAGESAESRPVVHLSVWQLPRPESTSINAKCDRAVIGAFKEYFTKKTGKDVHLTSPVGIAIISEGAMDSLM